MQLVKRCPLATGLKRDKLSTVDRTHLYKTILTISGFHFHARDRRMQMLPAFPNNTVQIGHT